MRESEFIEHELRLTVRCAGHLIAQGERALGKPEDPQPKQEVDPRMVGANGCRDPLGFLLGELYCPTMEGLRGMELIEGRTVGSDLLAALGFLADMTEEQHAEHSRRLAWLERVHDNVGPMGWKDSFVREVTVLANRWLIAETAERGGMPEDARWLPAEQFVTHLLPR